MEVGIRIASDPQGDFFSGGKFISYSIYLCKLDERFVPVL